MANLWVIVTGLSVLVEKDEISREPYMVLLKQVPRGVEVPPDGREIAQHIPRLKLLPNGQEIPIGNRDIRFIPEGEDSPLIVNHDPFLRVGRKVTEAMRVRSEVLTSQRNDVLRSWSRVVLTGPRNDAEIYPIHVERDFALGTVSLKLKLNLAAIQDLSRANSELRAKLGIANGLLYYRHIEVGRPEVLFTGDSIPLSWDPIAVPSDFPRQNGEPHYVAWVSNAGIERPEQQERFDRDFYLLYDLLGEQVTRYVPVIDPIQIVDPPGQCMMAYALG
jgi:hypothetical protein